MMNYVHHLNEANRIAKSIPGMYSQSEKRARIMLLLAHLKKACQLRCHNAR